MGNGASITEETMGASGEEKARALLLMSLAGIDDEDAIQMN